jgi:hypothetical protein
MPAIVPGITSQHKQLSSTFSPHLIPFNQTKIGVFRPSTHTFYLRNGSTTWTTTAINWGAITDLPVTGDWNGDSTIEVGVFRPSTHMFYLRPAGYPVTPATVINWSKHGYPSNRNGTEME